MKRDYSQITPPISELAGVCDASYPINPELYDKYKVNRGLRDLQGNGVLTGLTKISEIKSKKLVDGVEVPCAGELYYRGYNIEDLVKGFISEGRYGFEEITYLLLIGKLPDKEELASFEDLLKSYRSLPTSFVRDVIMKAPSTNLMNSLARSVLTLYSYDNNAEDISIPNVLRQCIQLIATFPLMSIYGYQAYNYYIKKQQSFILHDPDLNLSTAENILHMLRPNNEYTELEARVLDLALVLHAEHGGGNNSSFTIHVVSSSGTDTYSAVAAALASLKGSKHGGANIKVCQMFDDIKAHVSDTEDREEIERYLIKILNKEAFDHSGLIYGIGHAIYSVSDPRAQLLKSFLSKLSVEKGKEREYAFYNAVEETAQKVISKNKTMYKGVSANVDFYSGFVYKMLGIPTELFTPLFAIARIAGWSAHRLEELTNASKIIRPAYKAVNERKSYVMLEKR